MPETSRDIGGGVRDKGGGCTLAINRPQMFKAIPKKIEAGPSIYIPAGGLRGSCSFCGILRVSLVWAWGHVELFQRNAVFKGICSPCRHADELSHAGRARGGPHLHYYQARSSRSTFRMAQFRLPLHCLSLSHRSLAYMVLTQIGARREI